VALYIFYKFGVHIGPMLSKGAIDLTSCWCFFTYNRYCTKTLLNSVYVSYTFFSNIYYRQTLWQRQNFGEKEYKKQL